MLERSSWGSTEVNYLGNIGTYRKNGTEYGMGGAACNIVAMTGFVSFGRQALFCHSAAQGTYWCIDRADDTATLWFTQHVDMLLACTFSTTWPEKKHRDMEGDVLPRPFDAQLFHLPAKALSLKALRLQIWRREKDRSGLS